MGEQVVKDMLAEPVEQGLQVLAKDEGDRGERFGYNKGVRYGVIRFLNDWPVWSPPMIAENISSHHFCFFAIFASQPVRDLENCLGLDDERE